MLLAVPEVISGHGRKLFLGKIKFWPIRRQFDQSEANFANQKPIWPFWPSTQVRNLDNLFSSSLNKNHVWFGLAQNRVPGLTLIWSGLFCSLSKSNYMFNRVLIRISFFQDKSDSKLTEIWCLIVYVIMRVLDNLLWVTNSWTDCALPTNHCSSFQ